MIPEPQKFFIGVIDLFSILLPGAVLTYLFKDELGCWILRGGYSNLHGAEGWVVFLFSSYILGHFLFFVGSGLDAWVYDSLRKMTDKNQITRILEGRKLSPAILRQLAWLCFKKDADAALDRAEQIKKDYLKRIDASAAVNAFQWCKARLATEHPEALATVNRFEADSKFFRSFPVMLVAMGAALLNCKWGLALGSMLAMGLAFLRYMEQRFKSTQQAYWHILTLEASKAPSTLSTNPSSSPGSEDYPDQPTHAGGVAFRKRGSGIEYLLLQAKSDPDDWVLPKGHIEPGEKPQRCAVREVKEETGVWARIKQELKLSTYDLDSKKVRVKFYLMQAVDHGKQQDHWRKHDWLPLAKALERTKHLEVQELLGFAEQTRTMS